MNRRFRNILVSLCAIIAIFSINIIATYPTYAAASSADVILKKTLLNGLQTCYNDTYMKSTIAPADFSGIDSLMVTGFWSNPSDTDGVIRVPNNVGNTLSDADISCRQLFNGYNQNKTSNSIKGLFNLFGRSNSASGTTQKKRLLENLGYDISEAAGGTETGCISITYQTVENSQYSSPKTTNQICMKVENGKVDVGLNYENVSWDSASFTSPLYLSYDGFNNRIDLMRDGSVDPLNYIYMPAPATSADWTTITSRADNIVGEYNWDGDYSWESYHFNVQRANNNLEGGETFAEAKRSNNADVRALHFFSGEQNATFTTFSFVTEDKYALYTAYLNQELQKNSSLIMGSGSECSASLDAAKATTGYAVRNGSQWCALHGVETGGSYNIIENRLNNKLIAGTFKDVINELMGLNYDRLAEAGVEIGTLEGGEMSGGAETGIDNPNSPSSTGGSVEPLDGCFSNAGVLGWILCPVLKLAGAATDGIYDMIVENYLSVKSETMTSEALRGAWGTFQGYANILFAILLVFVILSQVTGIGLSNYGIKKVLPKLIITIILVNLSYILCAIAVDLSNIIGTSLNDLLSGMDAGGFVASEINIGTMVLNSIEGIGLTALAIGASGTVITIAAEAWPNLILVLFLAVISILISILFFFILLVVRQAAIIILVVIAPLAVVCYALPNTQKLFDRWLKAFSALLMVFPICGAVMGGCNYASRLLLSAGGNNGLLYYIIVMVLGVVPLFFIPSILKSSMSALGSIGAKLATSGERFSRWANRAIVGSQAFQDRKQEAQRNVNMARNTRIAKSNKKVIDSLTAKKERGEALTAAEQRQLSRAQFRRARALSGNRRIYNEDAMAEVTSQGVDYGDYDAMPANDPRRLATRLQFQGRETEDLSRGYATMYQNDGTAGSVVSQQSKLESALEDLEKKSDNQDAQARFKALVRIMSNSDDGRAALEHAMKKRIKAVAGRGGTDKDQNAGLQWAANEAMLGPNGKEFKRVASSLFNTLQRVATGGTENKYTSMAADYKDDGTLEDGASEKAYTEGIDRMAADILPDIDDREFEKYIKGLRNGKITGTDRAKLVSSAIDALNDPRIKLKPKTAKYVHDIANMGYTQNTSEADLHGTNFDAINMSDAATMASAGSSELDRIAEGFRNGTIDKDGVNGNQSSMLNVIQKALEEARLNGGMVGNVQLSGGDASKMLKILKDNGRALVDASGAALTDADYSSLMRIKHSRASYSSNWRQATQADVITSPGINVGDWIDTSGAHPRLLNAQELKEVQEVNKFNVRQRVKESAENGTPTP